MDVVADGAENNWVERERERERKNKKNNKERIFKWSVKKKNRIFDESGIVK